MNISLWKWIAAPGVIFGCLAGCGLEDGAVAPIVYTLRAPAPESHTLEVEALIPSKGKGSVELMMAVWSPGYYRREDYATRILDLRAHTEAGAALSIEITAPNRWRVETAGAATVLVSYQLECTEQSVTTNWVSADLAVLNGPATFLTLVEEGPRPHEVRLELPPSWPHVATALQEVSVGTDLRYRAEDFEMLTDSPILAGDLVVREFEVDGSRHLLVHGGDHGGFPEEKAVRDLELMVQGTREFWGFLPFSRYLFLNVHREGGGGLEHEDSTLVTVAPSRLAAPKGYSAWVGLSAHEYFHAFNVKRLRPVELGPFDYENPPETADLWVSEGLTTYFAELILCRTGLVTQEQHLAALSKRIRKLQETPGRRVQTLEESSRQVWATSRSGLAENEEATVSYYVKGPLVGFLLDVEIKRRTDGAQNLDDALRSAYKLYSGEQGFTSEEFREVVSEVAGQDLGPWLEAALATTEELDYSAALEWYGLRFAAPPEAWTLEVLPDPTDLQRQHLEAWLGSRVAP